ncbi:MAG: hypothetical protein ACLGIM_06275 [Alphaproteobacteria bacterium]
MLNGFRAESHAIQKSVAEIMWYMRGALSREEAWCLSHEERLGYLKLIEDRIDAVKKGGPPIL